MAASVSIDWDNFSGATQYIVFRGKGGVYTQVYYGQNSYFNDTGLAAGRRTRIWSVPETVAAGISEFASINQKTTGSSGGGGDDEDDAAARGP